MSKAPETFDRAVEEVKQWNKALNSSEPALRSSTGSETAAVASQLLGGTPVKGPLKSRLGFEAFKAVELPGMFEPRDEAFIVVQAGLTRCLQSTTTGTMIS